MSAITSVGVAKGMIFASVRQREPLDERRWTQSRDACLERLAARDVTIEMLQYTRTRVRFAFAGELLQAAAAAVREAGLAWRIVPDCARLCVAGAGLRTTPGIFHRALAALAGRGIPVVHFSDSHATMSLIIPEAHAEEGARVLRETFVDAREVPPNGSIRFDARKARVWIDGREQRLGARQADLLAFLIDNVGRVIEPAEAARHLFGAVGRDQLSALRVHMHNLRKKIEDDPARPRCIVTVPAQGYLFVQ